MWMLEPNLIKPTSFTKLQLVVYAFYVCPFCLLIAYQCWKRNAFTSGAKDYGLIVCGILANGQFTSLGPYWLRAVADRTTVDLRKLTIFLEKKRLEGLFFRNPVKIKVKRPEFYSYLST